MSHVLILGGGFGGLAAARELRIAHPELEVTLVSAADEFYMGFAKLWDLARTRPLADGTRSLTALDARGVRFVHAEITAIDPARCAVETTAGSLEADALLVALGAGPSPAHRELLSGEGAFDLYDGRELPGMHAALDAVDEGRVLVSILGGPFKCPPAPFEAALLVDERLRSRGVRDRVGVAISTPQPITLPVAGPDASRYVAGFLAERGIELFSESPVTAVDGAERQVTFGDGSTVDYRVLLGVPASAPPPVVADSSLAAAVGVDRARPPHVGHRHRPGLRRRRLHQHPQRHRRAPQGRRVRRRPGRRSRPTTSPPTCSARSGRASTGTASASSSCPARRWPTSRATSTPSPVPP